MKPDDSTKPEPQPFGYWQPGDRFYKAALGLAKQVRKAADDCKVPLFSDHCKEHGLTQ